MDRQIVEEKFAWVKLVGPGWTHYIQDDNPCVLGRTVLLPKCDVVLGNDDTISRRHITIGFSPAHFAYVVTVVGKNPIFVNGDALRNGDAPRVLRSHDEIVVGQKVPVTIAVYLPNEDRSDGPNFNNRGRILKAVGRVLLDCGKPLDPDAIFERVMALSDVPKQPLSAIRSSIRCALVMNPDIFVAVPEVGRNRRAAFKLRPNCAHVVE